MLALSMVLKHFELQWSNKKPSTPHSTFQNYLCTFQRFIDYCRHITWSRQTVLLYHCSYLCEILNIIGFFHEWRASKGPGRTSVKCCLFYKKICQQVLGFSSATDLSDIVKNERNVPNVQRCRHLKLPNSGPRQNVTKNQKSYLTVTHDANSIWKTVKSSLLVIWRQSCWEG